MVKGNKRGNHEAKKPKQVKMAPVAAPLFEKGRSHLRQHPRKRRVDPQSAHLLPIGKNEATDENTAPHHRTLGPA